jgi:hypothetical protein
MVESPQFFVRKFTTHQMSHKTRNHACHSSAKWGNSTPKIKVSRSASVKDDRTNRRAMPEGPGTRRHDTQKVEEMGLKYDVYIGVERRMVVLR